MAVSAVRSPCVTCLRPEAYCYCAQIRRFDPKIEFAILIHPIEFRRRIATGRMSHLCLERSHLIPGHDYSGNARVNALIENSENHSVILYPGVSSRDLGLLDEPKRTELLLAEKNLVIFVIDGTWHTARKTLRRSVNLAGLPRICFSPAKPSRFRIRTQPSPECYSTLEAIHQTIELIGGARGFDISTREHDRLLHVFDWMIERQLASYRKPMLRRVR